MLLLSACRVSAIGSYIFYTIPPYYYIIIYSTFASKENLLVVKELSQMLLCLYPNNQGFFARLKGIPASSHRKL